MSDQGRNGQAGLARKAIAAEAADWFVQIREAEPPREIRESFTSWLTESPVHVEEYLAVAKLWGELAHVDANGMIDVDEIVDASVVPIGATMAPEQPNADAVQTRKRRWRFYAVAASFLVGLVVVGTMFLSAVDEPIRYQTGLGEQRSVVLDDGSMVFMNTLTDIEVAFDDETRYVWLVSGEALFDVEKDPERAFIVETRSALVRVTGTKFNVYEKDGGTSVTVLEGEVTVMSRHREGEPAKLPAKLPASARDRGSSSAAGSTANLTVGEQAVVRSGSAEVETHSVGNMEPVTAWTERRLVFDSTPLSAIISEFNRYNRERLVIEDPDVGELAISGVFSSNDPESLILFLERIDTVDVVTRPDGSRMIVRANAATP